MKKLFIIIFITASSQMFYTQNNFKHILITNDDGIEDSRRLIAIAKRVSNVADRVSIVVSEFDRSGTSNYSTYGKYKSTFEVTCQYYDEESKISVYTISGNPADCIIVGLGGILGDSRPDLVLSGINGGPNIGPNWFGSGTIGAARTAAFFGVKAIALSGFDDDNENSFTIIPAWIKDFISSGFIDHVEKGSYLTIGFPKIPFEEIKGVKLIERKVVFDNPEVIRMKKIYGKETNTVDNKTIWTPELLGNLNNMENRLDDYYLNEGYVVITPMSINENDNKALENLKKKSALLPNISSINNLK